MIIIKTINKITLLILKNKPSSRDETFDKIVYLMNIETSKFRKPVFPNETIEADVVAMRSKGRVWRFEGSSFNEKRELVCSSKWSAMIMDRNNE